MTSPRRTPPSFTPQGGGTSRPASDDGAVPVGGGNGPVSHTPSRPARRPTSGGTPRVAGGASGRTPGSAASPGSASGAPEGSSAPRTSGSSARSVSSRPASARPATRQAAGRPGAARPDGDARTAHPRTTSPRPAARPATSAAAAPHAPGRPGEGPDPGDRRLRLRPGRIAAVVCVLALVGLLAWPVGLAFWANGKITHVAALSGAAATDGTTYLLAGSDSRGDGAIADDGTEGARTDTIMLLHVPDSGPTALVSLPRDTYTDIPGYGGRKLNAAYAYGGPELLVSSVEQISGLTVDHYVEVGLGGVQGLVDAVGGVNLCLDYDVKDKRSGLRWKAGCHDVDGKKALAFVRMRYSDPQGDIGRAERQRQLVGAVTRKAATFGTVVSPGTQVDLVDAGLAAVAADHDTGILDLGRLALAFRAATNEGGVTGTPPIASIDHRPGGGAGSTVLLDPERAPAFWEALAAGSLEPGRYDGDGLVTED